MDPLVDNKINKYFERSFSLLKHIHISTDTNIHNNTQSPTYINTIKLSGMI